MVVASITLNILGVGRYLTANGLDMGALLAFCAVFGFAGSFVSLMLSKTMAKMGTGTQIIDQPRTAQERWLLDTVKELSDKAGIGMPEVGIFPSPESNAFATGWNKKCSPGSRQPRLAGSLQPQRKPGQLSGMKLVMLPMATW